MQTTTARKNFLLVKKFIFLSFQDAFLNYMILQKFLQSLKERTGIYSRPFFPFPLLLFRLQKAVVAVFSAVYYIDLIALRIMEGKEGMSHHLHPGNGFI